MTDQDKEKYRLKHTHKINGLLFEKKAISATLYEFVIYKSGKNKRYIRFITFDREVIDYISQCNPKDRIKVRFTVKSTNYKGKDGVTRWYSDLTAMAVQPWKKNEAKQQKQQAQETITQENAYQKSLFTGDIGDWTT